MKATQGRTEATSRRRLNVPLFDTLTTRRGAITADQRAAFLGINRATYFRWRAGGRAPSLDRALTVAERLGTSPEDLWPQAR